MLKMPLNPNHPSIDVSDCCMWWADMWVDDVGHFTELGGLLYVIGGLHRFVNSQYWCNWLCLPKA